MEEGTTMGSNEQHYQAIYAQLDPSNSGVVTSATIVELLKTSGLPLPMLGAIWEEADYLKRGSLDRRGVFIALKLVAAVQNGHPVSSSSLSLALPPPVLSGYSGGNVHSSPAHSFSSAPAHPQWGISATDQAKYDSIFESLGPENGKVGGDKVRPVLLNSGLNPPYLAKIWELADQDCDGQLDRVEMQVALHLVYRALQGEAVPRVLPPHLIHPSKQHLSRRTSVASISGGHGMGSRAGSVSSLHELSQYTPTHAAAHSAALSNRPYSVQAAPHRPPSVSQHTPSGEQGGGVDGWVVNVGEQADTFARLDTDRDGLVSGGECAPLLLASNLSQDKLARLWSLVDIEQSGMLSLEQFALLVYLTQKTCRGEEIPSVLPPSLCPPSMRGGHSLPRNASITPSDSAHSISAAALEDDEDAKALVADIERLEEERRRGDDEMAQLESDMKAKQTLIKQLQVELKTLESTVVQLEKQKGEANRRLGEMDDQKARLLGSAKMNEERAEDIRKRMSSLQQEANSSSKEDDAVKVNELMRDAHEAEQQATIAEGELRRELNALEETVGELSRLERETLALEKEKKRAEQMNSDIHVAVKQLEEAVTSGTDCALLHDDFSRFSLNDAPSTSTTQQRAGASAAPPDPFAPSQPSQPAFVVNGGVGGGSGGKAPPPRPAPPSAAHTKGHVDDPFANADPFSGVSSQAGNSSSFADFANFGAFS